MFTKAERLISLRNLRPKKKEGFLKIISIFSFLGITLGVAILIIVMSVMNGFKTELTNKILGLNPHIVIQPNDFKIESDFILKLKNDLKDISYSKSYSGEGIEDHQGDLVFSREMSSTVQDMKGNILLCDDLSDTGVTLNKSIDWLKKYPPIKGNIKEIKTAVLWKKKDSTFEPDFCAQRLNSNPWIVQPFEHYEEIKIEDLIKKHQKN